MREEVKTKKVKGYERSITLKRKQCPVCEEWFMGQGRAVYDKEACRQKASYEKNKEKRQADRRERYAAQKAEEK